MIAITVSENPAACSSTVSRAALEKIPALSETAVLVESATGTLMLAVTETEAAAIEMVTSELSTPASRARRSFIAPRLASPRLSLSS